MFKTLFDFFLGKKWIAILWTLLILTACTWPGKDIPAAPVVGFDKVVHAGLFAVWSVLWLSIYPWLTIRVIAAGIIYGIALEFYQQLLPFDRTFDWWDAVADAAGVILGYGFKAIILDRYRQRLY